MSYGVITKHIDREIACMELLKGEVLSVVRLIEERLAIPLFAMIPIIV